MPVRQAGDRCRQPGFRSRSACRRRPARAVVGKGRALGRARRRAEQDLVAGRQVAQLRHPGRDGADTHATTNADASADASAALVADAGRRLVQQQAVGALHPGQLGLAQLGQAGAAEHPLAAVEVVHQQGDAVAHLGRVAVRQVGRRRGLGGHGGELKAGQAVHPERCRAPVASHRHHMPVHAAVVLQHRQHRQAGGQVLKHRRGGVQVDGRAIAQAEQAADMVNLRVGQQHRAHLGVGQPGVLGQVGIAVELQGHSR